MRRADALLEVGAQLHDGGARYRIGRVEPAPNPSAFGHVWARRIHAT